MNNKLKQNEILMNTDEDVSLWDMVHMIINNWRLVVIITIVFALLGFVYAFFIQKFDTYIYNNQVFYSQYDYYPIDFESTYKISIEKYLEADLEVEADVDFEKNKDTKIIIAKIFK